MLYKETCLLEGDIWTADATKAQLQTSPMLRTPTKVDVGVWGVHQTPAWSRDFQHGRHLSMQAA